MRQENSLGERADPGVDSVPLRLEPLALIPEVVERHSEDLDELVLLELGLWVFILRQVHVDVDVDHAQIRVAEAGVVVHDGACFGNYADVARFLAKLADSSLLGCLALVDETSGDLYGDEVNRRAVLLLQEELPTAGRRVREDRDNPNTINVGGRRAGAALGRFPDAARAIGILVRQSAKGLESGTISMRT